VSWRHVLLILGGCLTAVVGSAVGHGGELNPLATGVVTGAFAHAMNNGRRRRRVRASDVKGGP
jgi:putative effector of murein hydrolase